jgi:hypothetical protein
MMRRLTVVLLGLALGGGLALVLQPGDAVVPRDATRATSPQDRAVASTRGRTPSVPDIRHVFVINIENKGYDQTWGPDSKAPYLASRLRRKGVLLNKYYGTAHNSQGNYVAQVSGQGPNPHMQSDCQTFSNFSQTGTQAPQQAVGTGCVFGKSVRSLPRQMSAHHLSWKGYMEDLPRPCYHPKIGSQDPTQKATAKSQYATRHNPFVYFHSIINRPKYCKRHVVGLGQLKKDLGSARHTPKLAYLTPDLCSDGHDTGCADGRPGGLRSVNAFMKRWVPRILQSPAYGKHGLLIITADESDSPQSDSTACCGETAVNTPQAGIVGPGGGLIGALLISPYITPGTWSTTPYNHYSLLGSLEQIYGLKRIGYARTVSDVFGLDVYNSGWNE